MSIQSNINQAISLAGLLATQSPTLQERSKVRQLEGRVAGSIAAENAALKEYEANIAKVEADESLTEDEKSRSIKADPTYDFYHEAGEKVLAAEEELFSFAPSSKTAKNIIARRREAKEQAEIVAAMERERLAESREIVRGISTYSPRDTSAERQEAINYVKTMRGKK